MKIMVVMAAPAGTLTPEMQERLAATAESYSSDGIDVVAGYPGQASGFVPRGGEAGPGALGMARNHVIIAERMIQAEAEGVDACVPYGMMDFGVDLARGRCKIPIVGQARAAYTVASLMVDRFGVVTYNSNNQGSTRRQIRDYGFLDRVAGLDSASMTPQEMWNRSPLLLQRFAEAAQRLIAQGAEAIVCHGMSMSPLEYSAAELTEASGIPVIEGMGSAIALASAWHRLGTPYSPIRYR